jgi:hypothetical protein
MNLFLNEGLDELLISVIFSGPTEEPTSLTSTLRHQFPHVLLIECMLERMCAIYETDSVKQRELYDGEFIL